MPCRQNVDRSCCTPVGSTDRQACLVSRLDWKEESVNGPEPALRAWVMASFKDCPTRVAWQRHSQKTRPTTKTDQPFYWLDQHGCIVTWDELVDPIDTVDPYLRSEA